MRIFAFIILTVFTLTAIAQHTPLEKVINKYADKEGVSVKEIKPGSEEFKGQFKLEGDEINEALAQLESFKIISVDTEVTSLSTFDKFYNKTVSALDDDRYMELMKVHADDGEDVSFYVNQREDGAFREIVLLVNQGTSFMMVYVKGEINMSDLNFGELMSALTCKQKDKDDEHNDNSGQ